MRVTAILAFIASTVIPFIQELSDFISSLKSGTYSHSASSALTSLSEECVSHVIDRSGQQRSLNDYVKTASSTTTPKSHSWSRFLGRE